MLQLNYYNPKDGRAHEVGTPKHPDDAYFYVAATFATMTPGWIVFFTKVEVTTDIWDIV